jgi:hypothetical protein
VTVVKSGKVKPKLASTYVARSTCRRVTLRGQYLSSVAKRFVLERAIFTHSLSELSAHGDWVVSFRLLRLKSGNACYLSVQNVLSYCLLSKNININPFRFSCSRRFFWSLTLSNPIFLPPTYSPALVYFGRERGWWITCNYPTVLKEKNRNRTTCAICLLKSVREEKRREQVIHNDFPVPYAFPLVNR